MITRAETAAQRAARLWREMDPQNLDASWLVVGPRVVEQAVQVQQANTLDAQRYVARAATVQGIDTDTVRLVPEALSGVDRSGRDIEGLLFGAVTTTKERIGQGLSLANAMLSGSAYLVAMMKTAAADTGRAAALTGATAKGWTHYVRVVNAGACSRCAILAGIDSYKVAFARHPACKCTTWPIEGDGATDLPDGFHSTPEAYFESLTEAEQERVFTKAGAEAIRSGATPSRVVSARRDAKGVSYGGKKKRTGRGRLEKTTIGHRPDGTPIQVYTTGEGTTRRGQFGKQNARATGTNQKRVRLMPESIVEIADGDRDLAKVLLRDAGYIEPDYGRLSPVELFEQARADRVIADEAFRKAGFTL